MKLLLVIVPALLLIFLAPLSAEAKTFTAPDKYSFQYPSGCKTVMTYRKQIASYVEQSKNEKITDYL